MSHSCDVEEEEEVRGLGLQFIHSLSYAPLLKFSPVENLISGYYPDGVGQSVTDSARKTEYVEHDDDSRGATPKKRTPRKTYRNRFFPTRKTRKDSVNGKVPFCGANRHIKPFYQPGDAPAALTLRPDCFEPDEAKYYGEFTAAAQRLVLALRNLIVTLWSVEPCKVLTVEDCLNKTIIRGLIRVVIPRILERVLRFCTGKGLVNFGLIHIEKPLVQNIRKEKILIIGGGPSGISAASQLQHFGFEVEIIEARDRLGGRVDDIKWTERIAKGAMVINGTQNNPFGILTQQLGQTMHILGRPYCI